MRLPMMTLVDPVIHNDLNNTVHGRNKSWVTCHESGVMSHDLSVSTKPLNQLS